MGEFEVLPLEEVPPEMFVAMKRVSRPRHPHMNALVREGEDGSSEIVGFSDPARDAPCFGLGLDVSPQACVPGWERTADEFSELLYESEDCTGARAYSVPGSCLETDTTHNPRGVVVQSLTLEECGNYRVIDTLELDGRSSATSVSGRDVGSSTCRLLSVSDNSNLLRATKVLNPGELFVPMERKLSD